MFRSAPRLIARQASRPTLHAGSSPSPSLSACRHARRSVSTAPPAQKSRGWKSLAARLGVAGTIVYYYNTTDLFDEARDIAPVHALSAVRETDEGRLPTIESIAAERAQRRAVQRHLELQREKEAAAAAEAQGKRVTEAEAEAEAEAGDEQTTSQGIEGLEAEADQQGAFNPETGEINWDCPCLGGMAHGPCGEEFKAAFSCFVYSKEEPKGMDCIDKFKDMQGCFRQYPEIYGSEIDDDDDDASEGASEGVSEGASAGSEASKRSEETSANATPPTPAAEKKTPGPHTAEVVKKNKQDLGLVPEEYRPKATSEGEGEKASEVVPRAATDGR